MNFRVGDMFKWSDGVTMIVEKINGSSMILAFPERNLKRHYYHNDLVRWMDKRVIFKMTDLLDKLEEEL